MTNMAVKFSQIYLKNFVEHDTVEKYIDREVFVKKDYIFF